MVYLDKVIVGVVVMSKNDSFERKGNEAALLLEKEIAKMAAALLKGKKKK